MRSCKMCGREIASSVFKDHIRVAHKLTMDKYRRLEIKVDNTPLGEMEELVEEALKVEEEVTKPVTITPDVVKEKIFGKKPTIKHLTVEQLLRQESITEDELMSLVRNFKTGVPLTVTQERSAKLKRAKEDAERLKGKGRTQVEYVELADMLVKEYGFICENVIRRDGKKVWIMVK